jgi:hypothetical protein
MEDVLRFARRPGQRGIQPMEEFAKNVLKRAGLASLLAVAFMLLPTVGTAGIVQVGGPTGTNDWSQEWVETNSAMVITGFTFTMLTPGITFTGQTTAYNDQNETQPLSGWSGAYSGTTADVSTTGAGTLADFYFTTSYSPTSTSTPFSYEMLAYSGTTLDQADSEIASWNGSSWSYQAVPEASDFALLGLVLLAAIGLASRRAPEVA